jgi:hypothetical protein
MIIRIESMAFDRFFGVKPAARAMEMHFYVL